MPQDTQETVGADAAQVDAAKALIAQVLRDAWPHGHASANISMNGNCHVYVHRYGQCEIGYGADIHDALADVICKAEKAWPTAEQAHAAKIAKLRAELSAAEADMVQP